MFVWESSRRMRRFPDEVGQRQALAGDGERSQQGGPGDARLHGRREADGLDGGRLGRAHAGHPGPPAGRHGPSVRDHIPAEPEDDPFGHHRRAGVTPRASALGRPVSPGAVAGDAAVDAVDPASGPRLIFQPVPEPETAGNRLRPILLTDHHDEEAERLTGLGARRPTETRLPPVRLTAFADPEGNRFDLVTWQPE
jgi:Glyoxalase-like domain